MTAMVAIPKVGGMARERGHFSAWRAVASVPAMFGSLCLLLVLLGFLGRWEPVAMLAWLASAAAVFTRAGERLAVRAALGLRRPGRWQSDALAPVWAKALAAAGYGAEEVDLYVQRSAAVNAYAAGGRSVAVTTGALREFLARRLSDDQMSAVLVHDLGHHGTGGTRFSLVALWLATPWRFASRAVVAGCYRVVGKGQPLGLVGIVAAVAVTVAVVQGAQQGQWAVVAVLSGLAVCAIACPLADAYIARRSEYAADRFAAARGAGRDLATALGLLASSERELRAAARLLGRHPAIARRLDALAVQGY
jgi:STE24 endopeptidase